MSEKAPSPPVVPEGEITPEVPPQPVVTIASATEMVAELINRLPALNSIKPELGITVGLYVAYVANPLGSVSLKDATNELGVLFQTDPEGVRNAIAAVTKADVAIANEFAGSFKKQTGRELNIRTLNFREAVDGETKEQRGTDRLARELLVKVQTVVNRLGVRDLYTLAHQAEKKPVRGSVLVNLINRAGEVMARTDKKSAVTVEPMPDWLTPPILGAEGNDEYGGLVKFIESVIGLMDRYTNQPNMRQIVLDYLATAKIDAAKIEAKLERASELAQEQLKQSDEVLKLVGHDQQAFADQIDGLTDLRHIYGSVAQFFFPGK
jgi:hypothetical protein